MTPPRERMAAIDVGSNTILLTVAEYDPDAGLVVLEEAEDQPRLSSGLSVSGRLGEAAIERALGTLARMLGTCQRYEVRRIAAVATAAVREAGNGAGFVERVRALGVPLRVISPETEAALSYRSAVHHFPGGELTLVADIGGGSLELTGSAGGSVRFSQSLPLGAVKLTELGLALQKLQEHVSEVLRRATQGTGWRGSRIIGSGGTFATLASMVLTRRGLRAEQIHGTAVPAGEVKELLDTLATLSPERRRQTPGLKPERADIIVAGLVVVAEMMESVGATEVTVSGFGLRDGLLLEMVGLE